MRRLLWALPLLALLGGSASAAEVKVPPAPTRWVTDGAGLLSEGARSELDGRLEEEERRTGRQVLVYIARSTGDTPIEDWCVRAFEAWGVGKKGGDDGLVLFIFAADRKLRIEVGYGLEERVPDATASRIIGEIIAPRLRAGDADGALRVGVEAILAVADGKPFSGEAPAATAPNPGPSAPAPRQPVPLWQMVLFAILGIAFLILLITHPSFALWLLFQILSAAASGAGGGGSGRGGFSGGGGRSGGGGASGSW